MNDLKQKTERLLADGDAMIHCQSYTDIGNHIRALQAEVDRLQGDLKHLREVRDPGGCECSDDDACMFARQRDAFKAECEALRVDAARIDWIAENPVAALDVVGYARPSDALYFRAEIDHAINRERI